MYPEGLDENKPTLVKIILILPNSQKIPVRKCLTIIYMWALLITILKLRA